MTIRNLIKILLAVQQPVMLSPLGLRRYTYFPKLRATADLLMMPKEVLTDRAIRSEVVPGLSLKRICQILQRYQPDDFAADPLPKGEGLIKAAVCRPKSAAACWLGVCGRLLLQCCRQGVHASMGRAAGVVVRPDVHTTWLCSVLQR